MRPTPLLPPRGFLVAAMLVVSTSALAQAPGGASPSQVKTGAQPGAARPLAVGEKVLVSWNGAWYDATVLALGQGTYKIHYEGWASSWDEWVPPERMRRADNSPIAAPRGAPRAPEPSSRPEAPPQPTKVWSTSPAGRWVCRTWDAGQVNRVGEFLLRDDGTYLDTRSKGTGQYSFDKATGQLRFTSGPQKNEARVQFFPSGHAGKGHLQFEYSGGARLDCYREALP